MAFCKYALMVVLNMECAAQGNHYFTFLVVCIFCRSSVKCVVLLGWEPCDVVSNGI